MEYRKKYQFISIVGIDGSGKSTIIGKAKNLNPDLVIVNWEQILQGQTIPLKSMGLKLEKHPSQVVQEMKGLSRSLALATFLSLQVDYVIMPALFSGKKVIVESYVDVYYAKEKLYGKAHPLLFDLLSVMPQPELVILIDIDPGVAYERKRAKGMITRYECYEEQTLEDFVRFQSSLRKELLRAIRHKNHVIIDGNCSLDAIAFQIQQFINPQI